MIINTGAYLAGLLFTHRLAIAIWAFLVGVIAARTVPLVGAVADGVVAWLARAAEFLMLSGG